MRRVLILAILTSTIISASGSLEVLSIEDIDSSQVVQHSMAIQSDESKAIEYKEVKIKDGGVEQTILIEVNKKSDGNSSLNAQSVTIDKLNSQEGLIVHFNSIPLPIEKFEKLFGLKFKEKLKIGYYIFENNSEYSDIKLIEKILDSDFKEQISTIRANWLMGVVKL